jgi:hypothetical protein
MVANMATDPKDIMPDDSTNGPKPERRGDTSRRGILAAGLFAAVATPGVAKAAVDDPAAGRPFVEHRMVMQLSDNDASKRALILSVANNVLKELGADQVALDVVTFGPGIELLREGSSERARVDSLITQGVRFDICMNTVESVERETGMKFPMNPRAHPVPAGAVQILILVENGYTLLRP